LTRYEAYAVCNDGEAVRGGGDAAVHQRQSGARRRVSELSIQSIQPYRCPVTKHKLIEPRVRTEASTAVEQTTSCGHLPDALVSDQVQRLAVCAGVGAGLWTYGLAMDTIVRPLTVAPVIPPANIAIELLAIALSGLMFLYVRYAGHAPGTKTDAGLLYFVLNAVCVALLNNWAVTPDNDAVGQLSWTGIVIFVSSMIMPTTPRKMLATSLLAASMDPLAVWVGYLRGMEVPSVVNTLVMFMPNYACAVVATLPSHVLHRLGRRLRHAQEMGSYHLVELLGRGGMGEVWRGRHRLLARSAAIKLVRPELLGAGSEAEARGMLRRFEQEAQATAALSSPHTIRLFDFGITDDQTFYYVMELLSGRDLESLVRGFGPIPTGRALFLLRQICHSLADAHARGLVHRDVTPSNIYVCRMGLDYDFVKVLDFGLVKFNDRRSIDQTLMTGGGHGTSGTPAFMAPEIILQGEVDQRADVYAFGCVAYFMLTGELVFKADTPMKMFIEHLQTPPVPPSQRTEMPIPPEVDELVLSCLDKDPRRRPENADELLSRLERCRAGETWNQHAARVWWEQHLPELTGPLSVTDTGVDPEPWKPHVANRPPLRARANDTFWADQMVTTLTTR
jgi:serine/threonine protein kinase